MRTTARTAAFIPGEGRVRVSGCHIHTMIHERPCNITQLLPLSLTFTEIKQEAAKPDRPADAGGALSEMRNRTLSVIGTATEAERAHRHVSTQYWSGFTYVQTERCGETLMSLMDKLGTEVDSTGSEKAQSGQIQSNPHISERFFPSPTYVTY